MVKIWLTYGFIPVMGYVVRFVQLRWYFIVPIIILIIWIYPDVRKAGYSKQESAAITTSYVETIINDLTMGEWIKIIQKSDTNAEVDYFYVRDNIKKPTLTHEAIKV